MKFKIKDDKSGGEEVQDRREIIQMIRLSEKALQLQLIMRTLDTEGLCFCIIHLYRASVFPCFGLLIL